MRKEKEKREKITVRRLLGNVRFLISFVYQLDKKLVLQTYGIYIFSYVIYGIYNTLFLRYLIDCYQTKSIDFLTTVLFIFGGILISGIGELLEVLGDTLMRVRSISVNGKVQRRFLQKASKIDLMCYDNKEYFDDFVIAASQSEEMIQEAIGASAELVGQVACIVTLSTLILTINPIIAIFPILGFAVNIVTRFKITTLEYNYDIAYKRIMRKADYSKRVFYQPEYAKEIKLSDIEVPLKKQFHEAIDEVQGEAKKVGIPIIVLSLINWIFVFTFLSYFAVPMYLAYLAIEKGKIALGDVASMNNASNSLRNCLDGVNYMLVSMQKVGQFAERFRRFIDYEIKIEEQPGIAPVPEGKATLEIKNMSFRYDGADKDTLKNINMTIHPGEHVAFVGENGAGKTTLVKLLMRLYDVSEGAILYNGRDIRDYATKDYRSVLGAVFQDYQIYGCSLAENVMMRPVTKEDSECVVNALELAGFGKKLAKLPMGIDTPLTREFEENGTMLSGGEAQKVAIARMFAKSKKMAVAILDEPSSALDPLAEYTLNKNMMENASQSTVIFISHRLSTTREADRIYMFEHGEIIEQGTHEELMKLGGEYAYMFEKQAHYYQDELDDAAI